MPRPTLRSCFSCSPPVTHYLRQTATYLYMYMHMQYCFFKGGHCSHSHYINRATYAIFLPVTRHTVHSNNGGYYISYMYLLLTGILYAHPVTPNPEMNGNIRLSPHRSIDVVLSKKGHSVTPLHVPLQVTVFSQYWKPGRGSF